MSSAQLAKIPAVAQPVSFSDQVAASLRERIVSGELKPREKLPTEAALAEHFAVSRTVIREAISRLKSDGLVESRQGSGVFVSPGPHVRPLRIEFGESDDPLGATLYIVELRRAIEGEAAAIASERRSERDIARLKKALERIEAADAAGSDGVPEDVTFHRIIAEATGNPYYLDVVDFLEQFLVGATRMTRINEALREDFARQVREEHSAILGAIVARDPMAARIAGTTHLINAAARIRQADPDVLKREIDARSGH